MSGHLSSALQTYRKNKSAQLSTPAYCVFTNAELDAIVAACPRSIAELQRIRGFGSSKVAKFGSDIVALCNSGLNRPPASALPEPMRLQAAASTPSPRVGVDSGLSSTLTAYRKQQSAALGHPAYCIFTNAELDAIVAACPRSIAELQRIRGFGSSKVAKFGSDIVALCNSGGLSRPPSSAQPPSSTQDDGEEDERPLSKRKLPNFAQFSGGSSSSSQSSSRPKLAQVAPTPPAPTVERSALNDEQRTAADTVLNGANAFLTGAAGVGKSFLLRFIIQELERRQPAMVAVCAPTGIAASHVQGVTIHSWSGIGLGKGSAHTLLQKVMSNDAATERWLKAKTLVIDEVSMLDSALMDALDLIGRTVRGVLSLAFGGLQLVLCGDFFQLPPVSLGNYGAGFAFECAAWSKANVQTIELKTIVRQANDHAFIDLLTPVRIGLCSQETSAALAACHVDVKPPPHDGVLPTKLYCKNANVDAENSAHLANLPGQARSFPASDTFKGEYPVDVCKRLLELVEKKAVGDLQLKVGAQCLLTKNMPELGLVNGSRGVVVGFEEVHCDSFGVPSGKYLCPIVAFDSGQRLHVQPSSFFQAGQGGAVVRITLPLKLAWALTVHKSQGMSLSRAELMLADAFDFGQVYVALSRVTSLEGLWVRGGRITQHVVKAHPSVLAFYRQIGCTLH